MELKDYFQILNRRKLIIFVITIFAIYVAFTARLAFPPKYAAVSQIRLVPSAVVNTSYPQIDYLSRAMNTYSEIAMGNSVLEELKGRLAEGESVPFSIVAEVIPSTELIQITVEDRDAVLAVNSANALADILANSIATENFIVTVAEFAQLPVPESLANKLTFGLVALLIGLVGGIGFAIVYENLDDCLYTTEQIQKYSELPLIGEVPIKKRKDRINLVVDSPYLTEAFRRIRTNILAQSGPQGNKTYLITSADPYEGKTTVVLNLAKSLSNSGRKTLVIDADMYRPVIHKEFGLANEVGLSNVIAGKNSALSAIQKSQFTDIDVMTSGSIVDNGSEVLHMEGLKKLIGELEGMYDFILFDGPPVLSVTDPVILASIVNAVVLVVKSRMTKRADLLKAIHQLQAGKPGYFGVVANRVKDAVPLSSQVYLKKSSTQEQIENLDSNN